MARKTRQAVSLPTTQATPPIRFAPEDGEKTLSKASGTKARGQCRKGKCATSCLTRWFMRLGIFYLIFAALWRCPSQPFSFKYDANHELLVCREMASFQEHVSPALHEFASSAHRFVEPYAGKYIGAVHGAWKKVEPVVHKSTKQAHNVYRSHVDPGARELYKQAHKWSAPHRKTAHAHYKKHLRPHVKKFSKTMSPYVKTYYKDVHPHAVSLTRQMHQAYERSSNYYVNTVHPAIKRHLYHLYLYLRHTLFPMAHGHYFKHAHPHVSRLHKKASKAVDGTLRKYGLKERNLADSITESAKDTYEKVKEAVIPSESAVPVDSEAQESSALSENEIDPESGEQTSVLQARLDEEMKRTEAKLGEQESAMLRLVNAENDYILDEVAEIRRRAVPLMPERLEKIMQVGIDGGISSVFLRVVRELRTRSASLPAGTPPSDAWKESARTWLADQIDTLVDVYDEMRTAAGELVHATRANEEQIIQASVAKIRAQSRVAARTFYDVMEEAEFQLTYYEFEGWDTGMKRRARFFRESIMESLSKMSLIGDERQDAGADLSTESALIRSAIDDLFHRMEQGLNSLTDRLLEEPLLLHDRTAYAQLLLDVHEHLDALSAMGHDIAVNSTLRMRDLIFNVRESLNMTRIPDEGLLHDVAHLPPLVSPEAVSVDPTTEPVHPDEDLLPTSSSEEAAFATIQPVAEELVREAESHHSSVPVPSEAALDSVPVSATLPSSVAAPIKTMASSAVPEALDLTAEAEAEPWQPADASSNAVDAEDTQVVRETPHAPPPAATTEAAEQEAAQPTQSIDPNTLVETLTPVLAPTSTPPAETSDATLAAPTTRIVAETPSASETAETSSATKTAETSSATKTAETPSVTETVETPSASETAETPSASETAETPSASETAETPSLSAAAPAEPSSSSSMVETTMQEPVSPPTPRPSTTMARMPRPPISHSSSADVASDAPRHDEL
ncbi:hypothetical protein MCAP1_002578 [Malassezia caprae]|uniref:Uncharacterized protein n=1 Tax=Malassezia caprae TaxID=1381934 RepID=A0AAF0IW08_9BASI|nr:hypothetical protein MCAP1_002578 [Malassezia caprae]